MKSASYMASFLKYERHPILGFVAWGERSISRMASSWEARGALNTQLYYIKCTSYSTPLECKDRSTLDFSSRNVRGAAHSTLLFKTREVLYTRLHYSKHKEHSALDFIAWNMRSFFFYLHSLKYKEHFTLSFYCLKHVERFILDFTI